jgi:hypothetical protein
MLYSCHKENDPLTPEEIAKIDPLTGSYLYPVERSERKLFELGFDKYYDTCIIPAKILNHLTDEGLIESCLNYPPFFNLFYFDNNQDGFDRIVNESNVFDELFTRKDIASKLISKYETLEVDSFILSNYIQQGTFSLMYLEIILSQNLILGQMSTQEKDGLIREVIRKYEYRDTVLNEELFSSVVSALILGRILKIVRYDSFMTALSQNQLIGVFLERAAFYDTISTSKIIFYTREYLNQK